MGTLADLPFGEGRWVDPKKIRAQKGTPPPGQPIIPFPTGRNLFLVATKRFVPGYLRSVPSSFVILNYGGQVGTNTLNTYPRIRSGPRNFQPLVSDDPRRIIAFGNI